MFWCEMCVETMDTKPKSSKDDRLHQIINKPVSKLRLKLRVTSEDEAAASKLWRTGTVKASVRKYLRRERKKLQRVGFSAADVDCSRAEGGMAPENTTQYLMEKVYDDLCNVPGNRYNHDSSADVYAESLSPRSVYVALDSAYESYLPFQQRDFEQVFDPYA